ncbi:sigma factor-like helix-turn-helix DNA-binding protein [Streptosporangium canum]|uniref:RNA polymerase sigma factor n=1 Tax=Streptosporangium canum TaxID=324952 RepID=UPI0033A132A5
MSMIRIEQPGPDPTEPDADSDSSWSTSRAQAADDDSQAVEHGVLQLIDGYLRDVERQLAPDAAQEGEAARLERRRQDHQIMMVIQADIEQGREDRFRRLTSRLMGYTYPILKAWMRSGDIFPKVNELRRKASLTQMGRGLPPLPPVKRGDGDWRQWGRDDIDQLVFDLIDEGIGRFRRNLQKDTWDPEHGASLNTFFLSGCLFGFEKIYRRWRKEKRLENAGLKVGLADDLVAWEPVLQPAFMRSPESQAVTRDYASRTAKRIRDETVREILFYRSQDYTNAEAAEMCGLTEKAVEARLYRNRKKLGEESPSQEPKGKQKGRRGDCHE